MARALQVWSPLREVERLRNEFEDLFDRFLGTRPEAEFPVLPAVESFVEGDKLTLRADLPGIDPKDVEVSVRGNVLTVRGKRETRKEEKGRDYIHREISYGSFERSLTLPGGVKSDEIKASYHHGVLELTMPVPKELAARKVPIQIEGGDGKKGEQHKGAAR